MNSVRASAVWRTCCAQYVTIWVGLHAEVAQWRIGFGRNIGRRSRRLMDPKPRRSEVSNQSQVSDTKKNNKILCKFWYRKNNDAIGFGPLPHMPNNAHDAPRPIANCCAHNAMTCHPDIYHAVRFDTYIIMIVCRIGYTRCSVYNTQKWKVAE